jgi:hypothetical protein
MFKSMGVPFGVSVNDVEVAGSTAEIVKGWQSPAAIVDDPEI